jgi:hypothetical protein
VQGEQFSELKTKNAEQENTITSKWLQQEAQESTATWFHVLKPELTVSNAVAQLENRKTNTALESGADQSSKIPFEKLAELRDSFGNKKGSDSINSSGKSDSPNWGDTVEQMMDRARLSERELPPVDGKVADMTGVGITSQWGVSATDLGASVVAPNGKLVSVFGDTFSGSHVGEGDWRSPVALIGSGDANNLIQYDHAAGGDPNYARQLWPYIHDNPNSGWSHGGISTMIPSDLLRVGDTLYLHANANHGFGNVVWSGIWSSKDNGESWQQMAQFPGDLDKGYAQCWSWDYNPEDNYVYVVSTGFQRNKGIILRRVHPDDLGDNSKYEGWGWANGKWGWGNDPTPITPPGETWGELTFRRLDHDKWVLGGFVDSQYALGYRVINTPTDNLYTTPLQMPVVGSGWDNEDPAHNRVAQLYGGYILPGSKLDSPGGFGVVVSQWNTAKGYPYHAMQYKVTLQDTTRKSAPNTPNSPSK